MRAGVRVWVGASVGVCGCACGSVCAHTCICFHDNKNVLVSLTKDLMSGTSELETREQYYILQVFLLRG